MAGLLDYFDHIDLFVTVVGNEWVVRIGTKYQSREGGPNNHEVRGSSLARALGMVEPTLTAIMRQGQRVGYQREPYFVYALST
jgi:hypothetical protein